MNFLKVISLSSAILVLTTPLYSEQIYDLKKKADIILKRINNFCTEHDLPHWSLDLKGAHEKTYTGIAMEGNRPWLKGRNFSFRIDPLNGECIQFINYGINEKETRRNNEFIETEERPPQNWTPEYAIEVATKFVQACDEQSLLHVGTPRAEFSIDQGEYNQETKKNKFRVPYWWITFPRVDQNGHEFYMEYISVKIFETAGPFLFSNKMYAKYELVEGEPLTLEEVMPTALKYARRHSKPGLINKLFYGYNNILSETPVYTKLQIVKPHPKRVFLIFKKSQLKRRLAWIIWFENTSKVYGKLTQRSIIGVRIDAHTGKIIGADSSAIGYH